MGEELDPEIIKATQESLGKFVKRPPLTEKLLKKPPFRFLHDIVTAVIKSTGFFEGLFTEDELKSENVKDKETKIQFLNKVITVLSIATNKTIAAKPSKIVAGQDSEKTNELLQCLAYALENNISSEDAVTQFKKGSKNSEKLEKSNLKEKQSKVAKTASKEQSLLNSKSTESLVSRKSQRDKPATKNTRKDQSVNRKLNREASIVNKDVKEKVPAKVTSKKQDSVEKVPSKTSVSTEKKHSKHLDKPSLKTITNTTKTKNLTDIENQNEIENQNIFFSETQSILTKNEENDPHTDILQAQKEEIVHEYSNLKESPHIHNQLIIEGEIKTNLNDSSNNILNINDVDQYVNHVEFSHDESNEIVVNQQARDEDHQQQIKSSINQIEEIQRYLKNDINIPSSNESLKEQKKSSESKKKPTETSFITNRKQSIESPPADIKPINHLLRPGTGRPPSSRPGAPRIKEKNETIITESEVVPVGKINIIAENHVDNEEEENSLIIVESQVEAVTKSESRIETTGNADKGHLVQQILDSQKELSQLVTGKTEIEWEFGAQKLREASSQEVEQIKFGLQTLSRAANPLGKLLDYIQEDVEVMRQELQQWQNTHNVASIELSKQKLANEESLHPLYAKLKSLTADITEKKEKILDLKTSIHKNAARINKLLASGNVQY